MRRFLAFIFAFLFFTAQANAAGLWVWESGSYHALNTPSVLESTYHHWKGGWVWAAGAWKPFYVSTLSVSGNDVDGTDNNGGNDCPSVGTGDGGGAGSPNISVSGGSGSYTYSWAYSSGDTITISSSSVQNPSWHAFVMGAGSLNATWTVTATDTVTAAQGQTSIGITLNCAG